jgi:hypothetical protein
MLFHLKGRSCNRSSDGYLMSSGEVQIKFPAQFSHTTRIEQTAKGARITVRVLANNQEEAINQAIQMYGETKRRLEAAGHKIAPIETTITAAVKEEADILESS